MCAFIICVSFADAGKNVFSIKLDYMFIFIIIVFFVFILYMYVVEDGSGGGLRSCLVLKCVCEVDLGLGRV